MITIYISKRLRLPYYGHYINEVLLYIKVHLRSGYMLLVRKDVALPPFFQKNIVVVYMVEYSWFLLVYLLMQFYYPAFRAGISSKFSFKSWSV